VGASNGRSSKCGDGVESDCVKTVGLGNAISQRKAQNTREWLLLWYGEGGLEPDLALGEAFFWLMRSCRGSRAGLKRSELVSEDLRSFDAVE
jgi:hypothetical protein